MLGFSNLTIGDSILFDIRFRVGFGKAVEVSLPKFRELPGIINLFGKAGGLVTLRISSNINIKPLVFRHCFIRAVTTHMILSNMGSVVSIFFKSLSNSNS